MKLQFPLDIENHGAMHATLCNGINILVHNMQVQLYQRYKSMHVQSNGKQVVLTVFLTDNTFAAQKRDVHEHVEQIIMDYVRMMCPQYFQPPTPRTPAEESSCDAITFICDPIFMVKG